VLGLDQDRAGEAQQRGRVGEPTTSVRRLISLFSRSSGLVLPIFFQCETGKDAKAVTSSGKDEVIAVP